MFAKVFYDDQAQLLNAFRAAPGAVCGHVADDQGDATTSEYRFLAHAALRAVVAKASRPRSSRALDPSAAGRSKPVLPMAQNPWSRPRPRLIGERAEAKAAGNAIDEQRVLDLGASTDVVDDERTRSILAASIADDDDVRQATRKLLRHHIAGRIVRGGAADSKHSPLASQENLEIEHAPMVDAGFWRS
jgi:hypothetical protein